MNIIKRALYRWSHSSAEEYRKFYNEFGGSINMHPDVIEFLESRISIKVRYFHKVKNGNIIGAFPLVDNKMVGVRVFNKYPISYDEVLIPINTKYRVTLPVRSNRISPAHSDNVKYVTYTIARKNKICIVKDDFSKKTKKNRHGEYSRFLRAGGKCFDQSFFSAEELAEFYVSLFKARFGDTIKCYELHDMADIIRNLRHMIFGHVLFIEDVPCAFDLIFYGESGKSVYFDVPNGGVDPRFSSLSPGSVLMWKNIQAARDFCLQKDKPMRFSIGALDQRWTYKLRWADAQYTGKSFI